MANISSSNSSGNSDTHAVIETPNISYRSEPGPDSESGFSHSEDDSGRSPADSPAHRGADERSLQGFARDEISLLGILKGIQSSIEALMTMDGELLIPRMMLILYGDSIWALNADIPMSFEERVAAVGIANQFQEHSSDVFKMVEEETENAKTQIILAREYLKDVRMSRANQVFGYGSSTRVTELSCMLPVLLNA